MKFRKKPVVVDAEQVTETQTFRTIDGNLATVEPGDWIITGTKGERYPCRNDIFQELYEPVA